MTVILEQALGEGKVALLRIVGDLDASNYKEVIAAARQAQEEGAQNLLVDMSEMTFMSSSGMIALHSIAVLMRGDKPADTEQGWESFRALDRDKSSGKQAKVKLLNPQPNVDRTLEIAGLKDFFEIHTDLDTALASFE